jgi:hypothetical protein
MNVPGEQEDYNNCSNVDDRTRFHADDAIVPVGYFLSLQMTLSDELPHYRWFLPSHLGVWVNKERFFSTTTISFIVATSFNVIVCYS